MKWETEKSPSMVYGRQERFGEVKEMVDLWEGMEKDDDEWLPKEGRRRGGRRISRRISELIENFQTEGGVDRQTDEQSELERFGNVTFSSLSLTANNTHSKITKVRKSNRKYVVKQNDGYCASVRTSCDWSTTNNLSTNRRAEKRKADTDSKFDDNCCKTKKRRPGSGF